MQDQAIHTDIPVVPKRAQAEIVFACTVGNFVSNTPAISATFSLFLVPISEEFGWPRATVSGVLALIAVVAAITYPLAGRVSDMIGSRKVILTGNLLFAPAIAAIALASGEVWQFYLLFALVGLAGTIPSTAALQKVIGEWFDEGRGSAMGVSAGFGNGLGSVFMPIVGGILLMHVGWRGAYVGIGALVFLIGFPIMYLFLKDARTQNRENVRSSARESELRESGSGHLPGLTVREALHTSTFWLVLVAVAVGAGCVTAVFTHIVPMVMDRGYSLTIATTVISVFALVTAGWQVVAGLLLDRFQSPKIVAPMFLAAVVGLLLLEYGQGTQMLMLGGVMLGIGLGSEFGCLPYFLSRYFGQKAFGTMIGICYSVVLIAQGFTPFFMALMYDSTGGYKEVVTLLSTGLCIGAALIMILPAFKDPARDERG